MPTTLAAPDAHSAALRGPILVIEDFAPVRQRVVALLRDDAADFGHIAEAGSAGQARAMFAALRPRAVLLDLHLPDANGLDLLVEFRRQDPGCAVIILSSLDAPAIRARAQYLGAAAFLHKGSEFDQVTAVLAEALA